MVSCDLELCMFCGGCVAVCPKEAISIHEGRLFVDPEKCIECGNCITVCPVGAMRKSGGSR